jgi:predicted YcjX-like family ATPase
MNRVKLGTTEEEKNVGVYVDPTLKPSNHCKKVAEKARAILNQITKNFHYRDKHTEVLEKVQEKALRMTTGPKETYMRRCKEVGLSTLQ